MEDQHLDLELLSLTCDEPDFFDIIEAGPGQTHREWIRNTCDDIHIDINTDDTKMAVLDADIPDDSHWDQVMMFLRDIQNRHCYAKPDFDMMHSPTSMFIGRRYQQDHDSDAIFDFESWRAAFNHCEFTPFILERDDMPIHYRDELDMLFSPFGIRYFCYHQHREIRPNINLRTRPVCCDDGHRSLCWLDINLTYHRPIYNANRGMPICINAPVKGFQVYSITQHPAYRIQEMLHCGVSMSGGKDMLNEIDAIAIDELKFAVYVMRMISSYHPLWCHIFNFLNPHEKMIFCSMMFDADDLDIYHRECCMWMYGFSPCYHRHSLYDGHVEIAVDSATDLDVLMKRRRHSPCQQLMKYAGEYDIVNMINRHAVRVLVIEDWASVLFRIVYALGDLVNTHFYNLVDDGISFRRGSVVFLSQHRERHKSYMAGLRCIHDVVSVLSSDPRPSAVLRLFDRLIKMEHIRVAEGDSLATVIWNITAEECPLRSDLCRFFDTIDWDFNNIGKHEPSSSVSVFLLQLLRISTVELPYFQFLLEEFTAPILFESNVCGCDAHMLSEGLRMKNEIGSMIDNLMRVM